MELNRKQIEKLNRLIYEAEQAATIYYSELERRMGTEEKLCSTYLYQLLLNYTRALHAVVRDLQLQIKLGEIDGND